MSQTSHINGSPVPAYSNMAKLVTSLVSLLVLQCAWAGFTVSGVSSGGFMAVQMHVAYSAEVDGAAVIAGGPFYCAQGAEMTALTDCMSMPLMLSTSTLISYTNEQASSGSIDPVSNLSGSKAWVFSGMLDTVVQKGVVEALVTYYQSFGVDVTTEYSIPSEHSWVTNSYGNACYMLMSPYINNCDYDSTGAFLNNLYGSVKTAVSAVSGNLATFDQTQYASSSAGMASQGYIYVPTACQSSPSACSVHVAFHGCQMNAGTIGTVFVQNTGLNGYAEANNLIVLYPQTETSELTNPEGCWDWWGYTGANYSLKAGAQMQAVYQMVTKLPVSGADVWFQ